MSPEKDNFTLRSYQWQCPEPERVVAGVERRRQLMGQVVMLGMVLLLLLPSRSTRMMDTWLVRRVSCQVRVTRDSQVAVPQGMIVAHVYTAPGCPLPANSVNITH